MSIALLAAFVKSTLSEVTLSVTVKSENAGTVES